MLRHAKRRITGVAPVTKSVPFQAYRGPLVDALTFLTDTIRPGITTTTTRTTLGRVRRLETSSGSVRVSIRTAPDDSTLRRVTTAKLTYTSTGTAYFLSRSTGEDTGLQRALLRLRLRGLHIGLNVFRSLRHDLSSSHGSLRRRHLRLFFSQFGLEGRVLTVRRGATTTRNELRVTSRSLVRGPLSSRASTITRRTEGVIGL